MDTPRPTRRSHPNLHHLTLAPLTQPPLDASQPPSPTSHPSTPHTSYIQLKSAPTTPGILGLSQSRSSSRTRRKTRPYAHEGYFLNADVPERGDGEIVKAKSYSVLLPGGSGAQKYGREGNAVGTGLKIHGSGSGKHVHAQRTEDKGDEWLYRAGLTIANESRESKGQSWLVRRASSTSLVHSPDDEGGRHHEFRLLSGEELPDEELLSGVLSPRYSRMNSRVASRAPSARGSRRGSRVGSHVNLMMSGGVKTPGRGSLEEERELEDEVVVEPDFVDEDEEGAGDEEEVARLAEERGFGLGGWMDRLIGWTLFSVEEDGEASDEEEEAEDNERSENMTREELRLRKEVEAKRKKLEREAIIAASARGEHAEAEKEKGQPGPEGDGGGWQDAAWLLSVAAKVLV